MICSGDDVCNRTVAPSVVNGELNVTVWKLVF